MVPRAHSTPQSTLADNRRLILAALHNSGELTRAEISQKTGLSSAAVGRITTQLEDERFIRRTTQVPSGGGRPAWRYCFTAQGRLLIGARVQADGCHGVLTSWDGAILERSEVPVSPARADQGIAENYWSATAEVVRTLTQAARDQDARVHAVGVAVPSVVDHEGTVGMGVEVPWEGFPLATRLRAVVDGWVVVENDANALAVSEADPSADSLTPETIAALLLGHGLGAGVLSHGRLLRGSHRTAGEVGFLLTSARGLGAPLADDGGDLERHIRAASGRPRQDAPGRLWALLDAEDAHSRQHVATMLDYVALAAASLFTVLDPDFVVLGDIPPGAGERVVAELTARLTGPLPHRPRFVLPRSGRDAVMLGAARLAGAGVDLQAL